MVVEAFTYTSMDPIISNLLKDPTADNNQYISISKKTDTLAEPVKNSVPKIVPIIHTLQKNPTADNNQYQSISEKTDTVAETDKNSAYYFYRSSRNMPTNDLLKTSLNPMYRVFQSEDSAAILTVTIDTLSTGISRDQLIESKLRDSTVLYEKKVYFNINSFLTRQFCGAEKELYADRFENTLSRIKEQQQKEMMKTLVFKGTEGAGGHIIGWALGDIGKTGNAPLPHILKGGIIVIESYQLFFSEIPLYGQVLTATAIGVLLFFIFTVIRMYIRNEL